MDDLESMIEQEVKRAITAIPKRDRLVLFGMNPKIADVICNAEKSKPVLTLVVDNTKNGVR